VKEQGNESQTITIAHFAIHFLSRQLVSTQVGVGICNNMPKLIKYILGIVELEILFCFTLSDKFHSVFTMLRPLLRNSSAVENIQSIQLNALHRTQTQHIFFSHKFDYHWITSLINLWQTTLLACSQNCLRNASPQMQFGIWAAHKIYPNFPCEANMVKSTLKIHHLITASIIKTTMNFNDTIMKDLNEIINQEWPTTVPHINLTTAIT
jgi:hypothetical protein